MTALRYLYKAFVKKDEYSRYVLSEKAANIIYPNYIFSEYGRSFLNDKEFAAYYKKHVGDNVHSYDRKYFLSQLIKLGLPRIEWVDYRISHARQRTLYTDLRHPFSLESNGCRVIG